MGKLKFFPEKKEIPLAVVIKKMGRPNGNVQ